VAGKPFLDILLASLEQSDCAKRVVLAIGYRAEQIIRYYQSSATRCLDIRFSVEEQLLGTGGAIKKAIGYTDTADVLVMNGDSYVDVDYRDLICRHRDAKASLTIVLKSVPDAARYGTVRLAPDNRVISFEEKRDGAGEGLVNAGVYLIRRTVFDAVEEDCVLSMEKDLLPSFLKTVSGGTYGFVVHGRFIDIGLPESYQAAQEYLRS
jgi:D-glycero-alpha-D-manno-heptose 1-phosphate guanylyltransferase